MANVYVAYDAKNRELRIPTPYFRRHWRTRGAVVVTWLPGYKRGVQLDGGELLARVTWDDWHGTDYLAVPTSSRGVIKKTNRRLKDMIIHRRPAQWIVLLKAR